VEAAGIEPASMESQFKPSTGLACYFLSPLLSSEQAQMRGAYPHFFLPLSLRMRIKASLLYASV